MDLRDLLVYSFGSLRGHPLRTALSMLGVAIGVAAVILLTSIGEGTRRYVLNEFTQFGTNLLAVNPGKTKTLGIPGVLGGTTHKLTLDDAESLRRIPGVDQVVPLIIAKARVEWGGRGRSVIVDGLTADAPGLWKLRVGQGSFLPAGDPRSGSAVAVLGPKLKREIFGDENALGQFVRIGGSRFRVIGVMEPRGKILGFDIDDIAYIPIASALRAFNLDELIEIDVTFARPDDSAAIVAAITRLLRERHGGHEDFTVTTQAAMLEVFGKVMNVVSTSVGGIAGISLVVGAIGILTMMWIAVGERTFEIGLLRATGATARQVELVFLVEAAALGLTGGACGTAAGFGIEAVLRLAIPGLPVYTPLPWAVAGLAVSIVTGLLSGVLPARRAAALDPIEALRAE